jgi:uncharacterized protein
METQSGWKAKTAFTCYLTLAAGIFGGSLILVIILLGLGVDLQELPYPTALISLPINEGIILGITLLFAQQKGATLKQLGLKKPRLKTLVIVSFAAVLLLFLAGAIALIQESILGPDPEAELLVDAVLAQDTLQLVALISISLALVGPIEELAFRGFIQKGFENSFGRTAGLLVASLLFGLLHGLNSLRSIIPVTAVSLFLGYVWQKTDGNTYASAWMHGVYDAVAIAITYFAYA